MRISILTYGTRGDVQPFLALAIGLRNAGHQVRFAAPQNFADFVGQHPIEFVPFIGDPAELSRVLVEQGSNPFGIWRVMFDYALPLGVQVLRAVRSACEDADVIVSSFLMIVAAHTIACEKNIPHLHADLFPAFAHTAAFPNIMFSDIGNKMFNRLSHTVLDESFWQANSIGYNLLKRRYPDLPQRLHRPFKDGALTLLNAFSPLVVPPPSDWGSHIHTVGYWFLKSPAWTPPPEFVKFLESGVPPVCVTLSSIITRDTAKLTRIVIEALLIAKQRGILIGGWGGLGKIDLPDSICYIDSIPHDWLFPRVVAVVHHGGAGTTAVALRAGIPSVVIPFTTDQPFWANRVKALGVGESIPHQKLRAEVLARAINVTMNDQVMRAKAASLGERIRSEDGVGDAVKIIEKVMMRQ